jgi:hypothetical protein
MPGETDRCYPHFANLYRWAQFKHSENEKSIHWTFRTSWL